MLSKPSFRDELARFPAKGSARRDFIARWAADDDVEFMWESLTEAIPELRAQDLIRTVLRVYQDAIGQVLEREFFARECQTCRAKYDAEIRQLMQKRLPDVALADRLEEIAECLRLNALITSFIPRELSRQDQTGGKRKPRQTGLKPRKQFMVELGRFFHGLGGQWRDNEVAMLTMVAFAIKGKFDGDAVREVRRKRDKTAL